MNQNEGLSVIHLPKSAPNQFAEQAIPEGRIKKENEQNKNKFNQIQSLRREFDQKLGVQPPKKQEVTFNIPDNGPKVYQQPQNQISVPQKVTQPNQQAKKTDIFEFQNPIQQKIVTDPKSGLTISANVLSKDDPQILEFAKKNNIDMNISKVEEIKNTENIPKSHPKQLTQSTQSTQSPIIQSPIFQQQKPQQLHPCLNQNNNLLTTNNSKNGAKVSTRFTTTYAQTNADSNDNFRLRDDGQKISTRTVRSKNPDPKIDDIINKNEIVPKNYPNPNHNPRNPVINNTKNGPIFDSDPY